MTRANRCPRCGTTVSHFAAGCAVCGEDLARPRSRGRRGATPRLTLPDLGEAARDGAALAVILTLVSLYAPIWGIAISGLVAWDGNRNARLARRNIALGAAAVGLLGLLAASLGLPHIGPDWSYL